MTCITSERKTRVENEITSIELKLAAIDSSILGVSLNGTKSYTIDSGTGRAQQVFESPLIMIAASERLTARLEYLHRLLNGTTIIRQQTRRL